MALESAIVNKLVEKFTIEGYCPIYKGSPSSPESEKYRVILIRRLTVYNKNPEPDFGFWYLCSLGKDVEHPCYQPDCPWSLVSIEKGIEKYKNRKRSELETFATIGT